mmetsp:Transcript_24819/g.62421  ORF Transcript_24819/g.62421 Transcript_24819/m.62421 type:complete len:266 (-) Transcript_24819:3200-3997(-)
MDSMCELGSVTTAVESRRDDVAATTAASSAFAGAATATELVLVLGAVVESRFFFKSVVGGAPFASALDEYRAVLPGSSRRVGDATWLVTTDRSCSSCVVAARAKLMDDSPPVGLTGGPSDSNLRSRNDDTIGEDAMRCRLSTGFPSSIFSATSSASSSLNSTPFCASRKASILSFRLSTLRERDTVVDVVPPPKSLESPRERISRRWPRNRAESKSLIVSLRAEPAIRTAKEVVFAFWGLVMWNHKQCALRCTPNCETVTCLSQK